MTRGNRKTSMHLPPKPVFLMALILLAGSLLAWRGVAAATEQAQVSQPPRASAGTRGDRILYLDPDGVTVKMARPDGSDPKPVFVIKKAAGEQVVYLGASPMGDYVVFGLARDPWEPMPTYYLYSSSSYAASNILTLGTYHRWPRWSPDGRSLVVQGAGQQNQPGPMEIFNLDRSPAARFASQLPKAGLPDWSPGGRSLVYVCNDDVCLYDLQSKGSVQLTHLPHDDNTVAWAILEAHMLPSGDRIAFFGQKYVDNGQYMLGASGNGLQWYTIPVAGGTPQPWLQPEGNGLVVYAGSREGGMIAYAGSAHESACASAQSVVVVDPNNGGKPVVTGPDIKEATENADQYVYIQGLSWSPSGDQVAYGIEPYSCANAGVAPALLTPRIYTWAPGPGEEGHPVAPHKLADGSFPVWIGPVR